MIGFVTDRNTATKVNEAVANAQVDRNLPVFWAPGKYQVFSGEYAGMFFIPCDNETMDTPLRGNPPLRPIDFPEFQEIIESLGGLDARVDLPELDITAPDEP
jgi:hypothetical protein